MPQSPNDFAAPVRAGCSRVGGDYTPTYYRARCYTLSERSLFMDYGVHCSPWKSATATVSDVTLSHFHDTLILKADYYIFIHW